jgi:ribosomal protein S18 acetylase RimI-like enzyme
VFDVRRLLPRDVDEVVARIAQGLIDDATKKTLINPVISFDQLRLALASSTASTWIAHDGDRLVGHLYGAVLENATYGRGVWIGPDGASYDNTDILASLYTVAGDEWGRLDANEHFVWTLDDLSTSAAWFDLGFAKMHTRGVMELREHHHHLKDGYTLRRGTFEDLELAIALDAEFELAQSQGPSFVRGLDTTSQREDWIETLSDPETCHYIVDFDGVGVAQCVTFPLPDQRSSFENTIHLSAVVVSAPHRHCGVARAMIDAALREAQSQGFKYVEVNWRITNRQAARLWKGYGFEATYVRLHRSVGPY